MSILSNQKFYIVSLATLSLIGCSYFYGQSQTEKAIAQNQTVQNISLTSQKNPSSSQHADTKKEAKVKQNRNNPTNQQKATPLASQGYPVIDELQKYKYSIDANKIFAPGKLPGAKVDFNAPDLLTVLTNTRKYFQEHSQEDANVLRNGILESQGVTVQNVLDTLDFMILTLQEDIAKKQPIRLQNPNFINQNFRVIKWTANNPKNPEQQKLRITKYAVFTHPGSHTKTAQFNIPIYSLKDEYAKADKFYTKYTKQDVLSGIYEQGGKEQGKVEPLAYLTREGLEEALMEGTIIINFADGTQGVFNVDRSNEIPYVKGLDPKQQKRYWYFRAVDEIKGYGHKIDAKISIKPGVTFAGDVLNIGLGKVVVIESGKGKNKQVRLAIVGDTGGAFLPNLYQLDFLAGIFKSKNEFNQHVKQLPEYAKAYILVKK